MKIFMVNLNLLKCFFLHFSANIQNIKILFRLRFINQRDRVPKLQNIKINDIKLVSTVAEETNLKVSSIEDLTRSLKNFGSDPEKSAVKNGIISELDELIGDFLELSGQQYIVKSTLLINDHSVTIEEEASLEPVSRDYYSPGFISQPQLLA